MSGDLLDERHCEQVDQSFFMVEKALDRLYRYAVDIRYPGLDATQEDARRAVSDKKLMRKFVRSRLGLK